MPIDSALNSASGFLTHFFFKNVGMIPRKAAKLENPVKFFLKWTLWYIASKPGKCWNQNLLTNLQNFVKLWKKSNNSLNIAKSNCTFPGKGRGDRDLILTYLDSPMAEDFPHYCLSFLNLAIFRGKRVVKVGLKVQILGPSLFHENSNPSIFFKQCFCLLDYYFWWEFRQYWTI